jgi:general secretion pathway protein M
MMREWWQGLGRRERTLVAAAAALALAAALYVVAIEPAWRTRARLGDELPRLRAQAAEVDALALEARQLARRGAASAPAGALRTALEQSPSAAQLRGASVTAADERRLVVSVQATPVTPWLAWLEQAARESRLRVARVQISRTAARGVVDGEVTFERSAP